MGAFVHGFAVTDNKFSGGAFDWLTPFSVVTAASRCSPAMCCCRPGG